MFIIPHILYLLTADNSTWAISLYHRITINRAEPCSVDSESGEQFFYSSGSKGVFHSPFESLTAIGVITVALSSLRFSKVILPKKVEPTVHRHQFPMHHTTYIYREHKPSANGSLKSYSPKECDRQSIASYIDVSTHLPFEITCWLQILIGCIYHIRHQVDTAIRWIRMVIIQLG